MSRPFCRLSRRIAKTVKEVMVANQDEYSRLNADFQEKGRDGGLQFFKRGIMAGVPAVQSMNAPANLSRKKASSAKMILS